MKKEYNFWANKHNIPNLKLYTQLTGIFYGTLGLNFLLCFLYGKYILELEYAGLVLILSILMFMITPVAMTDEKRENRNLVAVIAYGIMHGVCTIGSIVLLNFRELLLLYVVEILIVIFFVVRNYRVNHGKGFRNS